MSLGKSDQTPPAEVSFSGSILGLDMHYYQHHIGDFIKATSRLSDSQSMAYLRLIWMYYDKEKPLKPDSKLLSFQIGTSVEDTELILESFFVLCEDGWHNTRCDKEIAEYHEMLNKRSSAGKASAERRKNKGSTHDEQVLNTSSTDVQLTNNHKPITNNHKPSVGAVAPAKKASRMTEDWQLPKAWGEWAVAEHNLSADAVRLEASKFRDYWLAKAGKDGAKLDWSATWRNWVRNSLDFSPAAKPGYQTQGDRNQDVLQGLTRGLVGGGNVKLLGN